jgi:predicted anti-sigma-YlaC factor YlaD
MKCSGIQKRLLEYVEAERGLGGASPLPENIVRAIESHIGHCDRCRDEAEAIRETFTVAAVAGELEPSSGFTQRTVRLLKQEAQRARARTPVAVRLRPVLAYAVILVALGILVAVLMPERAVRVQLAAGTDEFQEQVERYAKEIEFLAETLPSAEHEPVSYVERAHLDKIELLASSIDECWNAFEKNPENPQIRTLLLAQMQEEVDTLKSFIEVRSL